MSNNSKIIDLLKDGVSVGSSVDSVSDVPNGVGATFNVITILNKQLIQYYLR